MQGFRPLAGLDCSACAGMQAAALVISRLTPPLRAQAERVQFAFAPSLPIGRQVEQVLAAVAAGEVAPNTG